MSAYKVAFKSVQCFASQLKKNENVDEAFKILAKLGMTLEIYQSFEVDKLAERYVRQPIYASSARVMLNKIQELKQQQLELEMERNATMLALTKSARSVSPPSKNRSRKRHVQSPEKQESKAMRTSGPKITSPSSGEEQKKTGSVKNFSIVSILGENPQKKSIPLSANQLVEAQKQLLKPKEMAIKRNQRAENAKFDEVRAKIFKRMERNQEYQRKIKCIAALPITPPELMESNKLHSKKGRK